MVDEAQMSGLALHNVFHTQAEDDRESSIAQGDCQR